jgi:type II secretory pathway component PulF
MILIVVIPKISTVFLRLKVTLPFATQLMMKMSDVVINQPIPLIIVSTALIGAVSYIYKTQRRYIVQPFLSLPVISPLMRKIDLTRFTYNLYLLLNSGIPITSALELAQDVVSKKEVFEIIKRSHDMVLSGKTLSEGLKTGKGIIPSIMIKLIEAGERSGSLDKSLHDVSEYLDYEVSSSLRTAMALLEPIMLVVVGILVGGMMMAIIAPIYGLISNVTGR